MYNNASANSVPLCDLVDVWSYKNCNHSSNVQYPMMLRIMHIFDKFRWHTLLHDQNESLWDQPFLILLHKPRSRFLWFNIIFLYVTWFLKPEELILYDMNHIDFYPTINKHEGLCTICIINLSQTRNITHF